MSLAVLALAAVLAAATFAAADPITPTAYFGGWTVLVDGATVMSGAIGVNDAGGLYVAGTPFSTFTPDHLAMLTISSISGQANPAINFSVAATNLSDVFEFWIPIALSGPTYAYSDLSYTLAGSGPAGAAITPASTTVLTAVDLDTTAGGLGAFNKGVDIGPAFSLVGGPGPAYSGIFVGGNIFSSDLAYDQMAVSLGFTLTPHSAVGLAGFVEQTAWPTPVPESASSLWLLSVGLGAVKLAAWRCKGWASRGM
jgi:hypothetical protein